MSRILEHAIGDTNLYIGRSNRDKKVGERSLRNYTSSLGLALDDIKFLATLKLSKLLLKGAKEIKTPSVRKKYVLSLVKLIWQEGSIQIRSAHREDDVCKYVDDKILFKTIIKNSLYYIDVYHGKFIDLFTPWKDTKNLRSNNAHYVWSHLGGWIGMGYISVSLSTFDRRYKAFLKRRSVCLDDIINIHNQWEGKRELYALIYKKLVYDIFPPWNLHTLKWFTPHIRWTIFRYIMIKFFKRDPGFEQKERWLLKWK